MAFAMSDNEEELEFLEWMDREGEGEGVRPAARWAARMVSMGRVLTRGDEGQEGAR